MYFNYEYMAAAKTNNSIFPLLGSLFSSHASKPKKFLISNLYWQGYNYHIIWLILSRVFVAKDKI